MKLFDIVKNIGSGLLGLSPAGSAVLQTVNALLPADKKLTQQSTGDDAINAINALPVDQRASLLEKEIELDIVESNNFAQNIKVMAEVDNSGSSTRPEIAIMMARIVSFTIIVFVSILAISTINNDKDVLLVLNESWTLILVLLGIPSALLRAYFGMRTSEKKARYANSVGQSTGITQLISSLIKK